MDIKDLTIADVLKMPEFFDNIKTLIDELQEKRREAKYLCGPYLKAHPIDKVIKNNDFEPGKLTVIFAKILDKQSVNYSSTERQFIKSVGVEAFNKTMQKLLKDEEKRDNSNGEDK